MNKNKQIYDERGRKRDIKRERERARMKLNTSECERLTKRGKRGKTNAS